MKFYKKTVTLRLPLWLLILLETTLVILAATFILTQTSLPKTWELHSLRPENISSSRIQYFLGTAYHSAELTQEETTQLVRLINQVQLSGKPYVIESTSSPNSCVFTLKDSSTLEFGFQSGSSYYHYLNGKYYYICSDGFLGEGTDRYPGDLDLYNQWMQLYNQLCKKYFRVPQEPFIP